MPKIAGYIYIYITCLTCLTFYVYLMSQTVVGNIYDKFYSPQTQQLTLQVISQIS